MLLGIESDSLNDKHSKLIDILSIILNLSIWIRYFFNIALKITVIFKVNNLSFDFNISTIDREDDKKRLFGNYLP